MFHTGTNNNLCSQGENKLMQHDYNYKLTIFVIDFYLNSSLIIIIIIQFIIGVKEVCVFCHYFIVIVAVVVVLFKIQITIFSFADE